MSSKENFYGVKRVPRPKIKVGAPVDLSGERGRQIVKAKTIAVLKLHEKTFKRLADM